MENNSGNSVGPAASEASEEGRFKLLQGDCMTLMQQVPDHSVDLIVTDPPYQLTTVGGGCFGNGHREYHKELAPLSEGIGTEVLDMMVRKMKKVNIYIWCNKDQLRQYMDYFLDLGCNMDLLTWHKSNPVPACGNKYLSDTEYCLFFREKGVKVHGTYDTKHKYWVTPTNTADKKEFGHPTVKPLDIITKLVENSSQRGDTVMDPFMGTGTTGVACAHMGRRFIGMELDAEYHAVAESRIGRTWRLSLQPSTRQPTVDGWMGGVQ